MDHIVPTNPGERETSQLKLDLVDRIFTNISFLKIGLISYLLYFSPDAIFSGHVTTSNKKICVFLNFIFFPTILWYKPYT